MTLEANGPFSGYARNTREDRPLTGYTALIGSYNFLVALLLLLARRNGRSLPERLEIRDLLLLTLATYKLSRVITKDSVTSPIRAPFTEFEGPGGGGEVNEKPRGKGFRHAMGELLTCPFCIGQWVATGFAFGLVFAPRATRLTASIFSMIALADFLHYGHEATRKAVEGE